MSGLVWNHPFESENLAGRARVGVEHKQTIESMTDEGPVTLAEIRFNAQPAQLRHVRAVVRQTLAPLNCDSVLETNLVLALDEACTNVIRHGYEGDPSGLVILQILHEGDTLIFRLRDFAAPVDRQKVRPRDLKGVRPGGLGVHFIGEIMDVMRFLDPPEGRGNLLEMRKTLER